jgi:GxxExxY protein
MKEFKYQEITKAIIGAAMKVHSTLGNGFQEVIYQRALEIEFTKEGLSFVREFAMPIFYDGQIIGERRVDFFVEELISVELKAREILEPVHYSQARNYMEAYNLEVGLLLNFGNISLEYKRLENLKYNPNIKIQMIQSIHQNPRSDNE